MSDLPNTTLFMLMSLDGKISTGATDERDFDTDLPNIPGVLEGLKQYDDLEQQTDLCSFNTGKVMAKVGWNEEKTDIKNIPVTFVIVDNKPHLTSHGVSNLCKRTEKLYLVTTNPKHPARTCSDANLEVVYIENSINFTDLFKQLAQAGIKNMTIQSGGEMNAHLIREGLIQNISVVIAPMIVGGKDTPTLVDGLSLITGADLQFVKSLELIEVNKLDGSYLHLRYKVLTS